MSNQLLTSLYSHPLINPTELDTIISVHKKNTIKKGEFIVQEGTIANSYLVLASGIMRSFAYDLDNNDITTEFFRPSDVVIDVLSLFQRIQAQENIQAITDCIVWEIDYIVFQELYHSISGFSEWGRLWMAGKLFQFKQRSLEIITTSAKDRYDKLIKEKPEVILNSSLKYIASYLGITDTSLSRIRKEK